MENIILPEKVKVGLFILSFLLLWAAQKLTFFSFDKIRKTLKRIKSRKSSGKYYREWQKREEQRHQELIEIVGKEEADVIKASHQTIGHMYLKLHDINGLFQDIDYSNVKAQLNIFLDKATAEIKALAVYNEKSDFNDFNKEEIILVLNTIASTLKKLGYTYKKDTFLFHDFMNKGFVRYINCYGFVTLYRMVAQKLNLPISSVVLPAHIIIAWSYKLGKYTDYLYWETTDPHVLYEHSLKKDFKVDQKDIDSGMYLKPIGEYGELSVYYRNRGSIYWAQRNDLKRAIKDYKAALFFDDNNRLAAKQLVQVLKKCSKSLEAKEYENKYDL